METSYPGMWQRWFMHQCVAVGWYSDWGYTLEGPSSERSWSTVRNILNRLHIGDQIVVSLSGHRVGRIGEITGLLVSDDCWDPLVPPDTIQKDGEMGRRILVRWDLLTGPEDRDMVVLLPEDVRFNSGELRPAMIEHDLAKITTLKAAMNDQSNWVGLWKHFDYERALSGYIAAYPHRLEDGLSAYPNGKIRERVFPDQSRLDVILIDREGAPVIVECKQGHPTLADLAQLRGYIHNLAQETGRVARGILVHGGAKNLRHEIKIAASTSPKIEIIRYSLDVDFSSSK